MSILNKHHAPKFFIIGGIILILGIVLLLYSVRKPHEITSFDEMVENKGGLVGFNFTGILYSTNVTLEDKDGNINTYFYYTDLNGENIIFESTIIPTEIKDYLNGQVIGKVVSTDKFISTEEQHLLENSEMEGVDYLIDLEERAFKSGSNKTIANSFDISITSITLLSIGTIALALGIVCILNKEEI